VKDKVTQTHSIINKPVSRCPTYTTYTVKPNIHGQSNLQ